MTNYFPPTTSTFHPASSVSGLDTLRRGSAGSAEPGAHHHVGSPTASPARPPRGRRAGIIATALAGAVAVGFVVAANDSNPDVVDPQVELSVAEPGQSSQAQVQRSIDEALADAGNAQSTPDTPHPNDKVSIDAIANAETTPDPNSRSAVIPARAG